VIHLGGSHILQPKRDHTGDRGSAYSRDAVKIEIVGQDHPTFAYGLGDDLVIAQPLEPLVAQVDSIMPLTLQEGHRAAGQSHIGKELHPATPAGV
jgi:hypothetical protein